MSSIHGFGLGLSFALCLVVGTPVATAATFEVLYEFPATTSTGITVGSPGAGVSVTPDGSLLGATPAYKAGDPFVTVGVVYRLRPSVKVGAPWTFDLVHSFSPYETSGAPQAELTRTREGSYVGASTNHGVSFELTPSVSAPGGWDFAVTHTFTSKYPEGAGPTGALTEAADGSFYGTSDGSEPYTYGSVFRLARPDQCACAWTFDVLFAFDGNDGGLPSSRPVVGAGGVIYATQKQARGGGGAVFSLTPPATTGAAWTYTLLHHVKDSPLESGLIPDGAGGYFGVASSGGAYARGYVYRLLRPQTPGAKWTMAKIHSFMGGPSGSTPQGELVRDANGVLYGVTYDGYRPYTGTVYTLTPPATSGGRWRLTTLHRFIGQKGGMHPVGRVALGPGGWIYGVTKSGGAANLGLVYRVKP